MASRSDIIQHRTGPSGREAVSSLGLAAVVTALHVAVLARRVPAWCLHPRQTTSLTWQMPARSVTPPATSRMPSRPVQAFAVGQLALAAGMAVVTLAAWLHIMRITGAHGP